MQKCEFPDIDNSTIYRNQWYKYAINIRLMQWRGSSSQGSLTEEICIIRIIQLCVQVLPSCIARWIIKSFNLFITILFTFIWIIKLIRKNSNNSYPRVPGSDGYTDTHFFMVQLIMTHWNNRRKQQGLRFN